MKKWARNLFSSIQAKIILVMATVLGIVLAVNILVFRQSSAMVQKVGRAFVTNSTVVQLSESLRSTQQSLYAYLNTRSSAELENFYRYEQQLMGRVDPLNDKNIGDPTLMLEKNIREMTNTYLSAAETAVQAKRGRNVEEYKEAYGRSSQLYDYINSYIYALNTTRFEQNTGNYQALLRSVNLLEGGSIVFLAAAVFLALLIASMLIRTMIRPLRSLARSADLVAAGNLDTEIPLSGQHDEIGTVTNAFRGMLESIRRYIERQRISMQTEARLKENEAKMKENELAMEAHLKDAQLKFLQAQINPHFLFNSLNAGAQLAMMEDAGKTGDFLSHMADFFRYNVQNNGGNVTLQEELQSVDNYIYILNVRFAGDIHFRKSIEDGIDLAAVRMPSLILQPLVENAVQHGIHDDHENGVIELTVDRAEADETAAEADCVRVMVSDNGAGMTARQIKEVFSGKSGGGIALGNVSSRLELYYRKRGLFSIWSDGPGCGTVATVLLPNS